MANTKTYVLNIEQENIIERMKKIFDEMFEQTTNEYIQELRWKIASKKNEIIWRLMTQVTQRSSFLDDRVSINFFMEELKK